MAVAAAASPDTDLLVVVEIVLSQTSMLCICTRFEWLVENLNLQVYNCI
jgi:hypothetical protein